MRHLLIDTDTASDDAVALVMALTYPGVKTEAITVVAGNVPVEQGVQNALYTSDMCGVDVNIYQGAAAPILRPLQTAQFIHGQDGMGDIGLDLYGRQPKKGNAIDVIIDTIFAHPGKLELVTLGPLTNIAIAILKEPSMVTKVKQCTIMGGVGKGHGNITPVSEYNIWADPEAASIVFSSGMPITMVGWDISREYSIIDKETRLLIRALDSPLAHFSIDIQETLHTFATENSGLPGYDLPDAIAMAIALDASVITVKANRKVEVITDNGITRGQTVIHHINSLHYGNAIDIVLTASRDKFLNLLFQSLI